MHFAYQRLEENEDDEVNQFYGWLQNLVTLGVFYGIVLFFSFLWLRTRTYLGNSGVSFPFVLTVIVFSTAVCLTLLLPVSILAHEVLLLSPSNYYIKWLKREAVFDFWNYSFIAGNVSMYVLLPFAYFYSETSQYHKRRIVQGFLPRFREALCVYILFLLILFGIISLSNELINGTQFSSLKFVNPLSFSLMSLLGSFIVLFSVPVGFSRLVHFGSSLRIPVMLQSTARQQIELIQFEIDTIQYKQSIYQKMKSNQNEKNLNEKLLNLNFEKQKLSKMSHFLTATLWNFFSILIFCLNLILPFLIFLRVVFHTLLLIFSHEIISDYLHLESSGSFSDSIRSLIEISSCSFLILSSLFGAFPVFSSPPFSLHILILNVGLFLLMSSAFPVVFRLLGLISFDLMGFWAETGFLREKAIFLVYSLLFCIVLVYQYLTILPNFILRKLKFFIFYFLYFEVEKL